jgi:Fe-S-cluster-containing hydrogenase component 2
MADRSDLINQLAASMGAGQFAQTTYEESRFDPETGTLYCNGMVISASVAEQAIKHFETVQKKCDMNEPASRQMAMIYQCAIEAIKIMQNPKLKAFMNEKLTKESGNRDIS